MEKEKRKKARKLVSILRTGVFVSIIGTFLVTLLLANYLLSERTKKDILSLLTVEVQDMTGYVEDRYKEKMEELLRGLTYSKDGKFGLEQAKKLVEDYRFYSSFVSEILHGCNPLSMQSRIQS